jgi:tripartite-type tricarboxylate transporter receptor subunit TctC
MGFSRKLAVAAVAAITVLGGLAIAQAQDYPSRVIKLVIPYPPGGPTDTIGRLLALKLGQNLQQQVIVENKPGAGGNVGTNQVAKSAPDGYTIVMGTNGPLAGNLALVNDMPYDPLKDLAPITLAFHAPSLLAINPAVDAKSVAELIGLMKANPTAYSFASAGLGTSAHFAGELFKSTAGVQVIHVPFNGDGPSMMSVLSGQPQVFFGSVATALPQIRAGKLRVLAVTSAKRVPLLSEVPTLAESGLAGFDLGGWYAVMAPAGTAPAIIQKLNKAFIAVVNDSEVSAKIKSMGGIPVGSSPEEVTDLIRRDIPKWAAIARESGATRN